MKKILSPKVRALAFYCAIASLAQATPLTVTNASFELPVLGNGGFTSNWTAAGVAWTGTNGNNNTNAFFERIVNGTGYFSSPNTGFNHLGMALGYDVWQDLTGVTYQANTEYILRVAVGRRNASFTVAGNNSQYFLANVNAAPTLYASGSVNASTLIPTDLTFTDAPPIVLRTSATPAAVGQTIRVLLRAGGAGRSHFDNIRVSQTTAPVVGNGTATAVLATSATLNPVVTSTGESNTFTATLYWGATDGGTTPASWTNSVPLTVTPSATLTAAGYPASYAVTPVNITGLTQLTTYYWRVVGSNFAGTVFSTSTGSFTTPALVLPTLQNNAATNLAIHSATLNGQILTTGGDNPQVTTYWGTSDGGTTPGAWQFSANLGAQGAAFSNTPTNLLHGTTYYFRSSATNNAGTAWAPATLSFNTVLISPPTLEIVPAIGTTGYTSLLNGRVLTTGNDTPTVTYYWGTTDGGTTPANWANSAPGGLQSGPFGYLAKNLSPSTTYFWRASATNEVSTVWAPATLSFTTNAKLPVFINEINYDPDDHTKPVEFIELWNPSTTPVNISGWSLNGPVTYAFPSGTTLGAGAFVVVAQNPAAMLANYSVTPLGPWTGKLKNSGGHIVLNDAANVQVDDADYSAGFPWPTQAKGGGSSAELVNPGLENDVGGSWRSSKIVSPATTPKPTPGAINSVYAGIAPPSVSNVDFLALSAPVGQPASEVKSGQAVKITAYADDRNGLSGLTLQYQIVDPGAYIPLYLQNGTTFSANPAYQAGWVSLSMLDDGLGNDAVAGDQIYTVTLPGNLSVHRRLVRYRIVATDLLGTSATVPYAGDDEQPNFAYFIYDTVPSWTGSIRPGTVAADTYSTAMLNTLKPWQLIMNEADLVNCSYNSTYLDKTFSCTLIHDGKIYDNIIIKNRGIGSTYVSGKTKFALKFDRARDFQALDNWGKKYSQTWNSVSLDANASPWAAVNRGSAGIEEATCYRAFDLAGVPSLRTNYVHLRVIRRAAEVSAAGTTVTDPMLNPSGDGQYSGDLMGLYMALEPMESNFIGERGMEDGNIYSIEGYNGDKKAQSATQPATTADWDTFKAGAILATQTEAWYRQYQDLPSLYTFMGMSRLLGNVDVRPGDNYRYFHRPSDDRWVIMPYDLDMVFIAAHHWGGTGFLQSSPAANTSVTAAGCPNVMRAIGRFPAIALEYRNRCRELLSLMASDGSANGGQIGQLLDEYAQMVNPTGVALTWADLDAAMWNMHPRSAGTVNAVTGQSNHKSNFFRATYNDGTRGGLGGTLQTVSWIRQIPDPDGDGFGDHEGLTQWFTNYATNTYPTTATTWYRKATTGFGTGTDTDVNRQKGYGYKYLEWESIYGGWIDCLASPAPTDADLNFPNKPTISFGAGAVNHPVNDIRLLSGDFSDPQGAGTIAAVQFRVGEISAPGIPLYDPTAPRIYEIETLWTSAEIATTSPTGIAEVRVPTIYLRPGHTYRARVRHKDNTGRWSYWSEPLSIVPAAPDVSLFTNSIVISEYSYNPAPATSAEILAGYGNDDFEFIELKNISNLSIDLTDVRFTKGINFDFPAGTTIPAGGFKLVVRNLPAFQMRYGTSLNGIIAGSYPADKLSNGGEEIKLSYGAGAPIRDWTFAPTDVGPAGANGNGKSVVLNAPNTNPDHAVAANWRPSSVSGGSPGADDSNYALWAAATGANANPDADDDHDGIINRLEYAFGGSTGTPNDSGSQLPAGSFIPLTVNNALGTYLTATFTRPTLRDDLTYVPEFSTDLTAWTGGAVLVSRTDNNDGTTTEFWRSPAPVDTMQRWFIHVKVTQL